MLGDEGRCREVQRGVALKATSSKVCCRCREVQGGAGRCRELQGGEGRCMEDVGGAAVVQLQCLG